MKENKPLLLVSLLSASLFVGCPPTPTPPTPVVCSESLPINISTGFDENAGSVFMYTAGTDDDWQGSAPFLMGGAIVDSGLFGLSGPSTGSGGGSDIIPNSGWIRPKPYTSTTEFTYQIEFCLPVGYSNPLLSFDFLVRDSAKFRLNGTQFHDTGLASGLPFPWNFPALHAVTADAALFQEGTNLLEVEIATNFSNHTAYLDLQGFVHADPPPDIDLELTKTVDLPIANEGDTVTFTVTLDNASAAVASGVAVTDALPSGLSYVSHTATHGTYDSGTGLWDVGVLNLSGVATLTIDATVDVGTAGTTMTNTAEVTAAVENDVDSIPDNADPAEDDIATADVMVPAPAAPIDLSLTKVALTPGPLVIGSTVVFQIALGNDSVSPATGVVVTDTWPAGLTFVSASPTTGSYDALSGAWTVAMVPAFGTTSLVLTGTVPVGTVGGSAIFNVAEVTVANEVDVDSIPGNADPAEDDWARAFVTVTDPVDLALEFDPLGTSLTTVEPQSTFKLGFGIKNTSGILATNVVVAIPMPVGFTVVNASPTSGSFDLVTGEWTLPSISGFTGAEIDLAVTAPNPPSTTDFLFPVEVVAADQTDVDSTPGNGAEDDFVEPTVTVQL